MDIFGVDFSGSKTGKGTWVVRGSIIQGKLLITEIVPQTEKDPVRRVEKLAQQIKDSPNSLWALDFPFSLPEKFAKHVMPEPNNSWFTLAQAFKSITLHEFKKKADDYCRQESEEPRRFTDKQREGTFSALHKVNPDMRPMTYYGIQLLVNLVSTQVHVNIPTIIQCPEETLITILEIHPRSTLLNIFDGQKRWWGYKKRENYHLRKSILERLQENHHCPLVIDKEQRKILLDSHDALDSLIACWTGGLWLEKPELFDFPQDRPELQLEGWIWTPKSNLFKPSS